MPRDDDADDGRLRPYTELEIASWHLKRRGVRADHEHIVDRLSPDSCQSTRWFSCDWEDRYHVVNYMVGEVSVYTDADDDDTVKLSRIMPQTHPDPQFGDLWMATGIPEIRGFKFLGTIDDDTGLPDFERADIRVMFEPTPMLLKSDAGTTSEATRYVIYDGYAPTPTEMGSEYITLPGGSIRFNRAAGMGVPQDVPIPYNVGIVEGEEKFSIVWERLPMEVYAQGSVLRAAVQGNPEAGTRGLVGAINKTSTVLNRPPGTCMLLGVTPQRYLDPTGLGYVLRLKYDFLYRAKGFLNFYYYDRAGSASGYYQAGTTSTHLTIGTDAVPDTFSIHHVRDLGVDLFNLTPP